MTMSSFVPYSPDSDFPIQNIPFGIISTASNPTPRPATAIGDYAVDLSVLANAGLFTGPLLAPHAKTVFSETTLNAFMAMGRPVWREARQTLQSLLAATGDAGAALRDNHQLRDQALTPLSDIQSHMPASIGDYTDFYASKEHATNVGTMFRGKENALMPNWVHIPVGYHGRASSVVISGTPIRRPCGLVLNPTTKVPEFSASRKMDIELEVAFFVGVGNHLGDRIDVSQADDHIFGMVLMNDWSSRDIQQFEYVPLGPFLGKNFGTTISPWIVTLDALEEARVDQPAQEPTPSEYLLDSPQCKNAYDVNLEVQFKPKGEQESTLVCKSNLKYMYWTFKQQLAHHTINGCNMKTGDLCGSGTISGPTTDSLGSLLELTYNGSQPLTLKNDVKRSFVEDGDEIIISGSAHAGSVDGKAVRLGFGKSTGVVLPAAFGTHKPDPSFDQSRAHGTRYLMLARMDALWTARKAIQIGILVDTHPFSVDHCILCNQQLLSTSIAHLVVDCEQVTDHRIQSGLVPAIQKSRLRLLGRSTRSGCGECIYLAPRWSLKWRSRSGPALVGRDCGA
ncbi:fumarylacetoacetase [Batrachochytrium salamandrivorans]|nr:fumarylacetoacetase [Batrachochytrium salamandrivorans]